MSESGYTRTPGSSRRRGRSTPESRHSVGNVRFGPDFVCSTPGSGPPRQCPDTSADEPRQPFRLGSRRIASLIVKIDFDQCVPSADLNNGVAEVQSRNAESSKAFPRRTRWHPGVGKGLLAARDVKRRLAAILADMVGYSQLSEADDASKLADRRERKVDHGADSGHDRGHDRG